MDYSDVFISYRRKNVDFVKQLDAAFKAKNLEVWVDWEDIPPGSDEFSDDIKRGIEGADTFVAVLSPDYLESTYCMDLELGYAIQLQKKIIPIVYQKFDGQSIPAELGHINWIYFIPHAGQSNAFDEAFARVVQAMETDLDHVRTHTRLLLRAQEWNDSNRERSFLLDGVEVKDAEQWLAHAVNKNPIPTELHSEYIYESRDAEARRQRTLLVSVSVAMVLMTLLALASVFLWYDASQQRETAERNLELAQTSQAEAEEKGEEAQSLLWASISEQELDSNNNLLALALALSANEINNPPALSQRILAEVAYTPGPRHMFTEHRDAENEDANVADIDPHAIIAVAFNEDNTLAVSIERDLHLIVWDIDRRSPNFNRSVAEIILDISPDVIPRNDSGLTLPFELSTDGNYGVLTFIDSNTDEVGAVIDLATESPNFGGIIHRVTQTSDTFPPHLSFHDDSNLVYINQCVPSRNDLCSSSELTIWDADTREVRNRITGNWGQVIAVNPIADLMLIKNDSTLSLWTTDGELAMEISESVYNSETAIFSDDGRLILITGSLEDDFIGSALILIDVESGNFIQEYREPEPQRYSDIAFSADMRSILVSQITPNGVRFTSWNTITGRRTRQFTISVGFANDTHFSRDGRNMLIGARDGAVYVWDTFSGIEARRLTHVVGNITGFAINTDNTRALINVSNGDLILWDRVDLTTLNRYNNVGDALIAYLPDSINAVVTTSQGVQIWNTETGEVINTITPDNDIKEIDLSTDGTQLLTVDNGDVVTLWDIATSTEIRQFTDFAGGITHVDMNSAGDRVLASGQSDDRSYSILIWDTNSGEQVREFSLPVSAIQNQEFGILNPALFSLDGEYVIAGANDGRLFLWEMSTGALSNRFITAHETSITTLDISPDGQSLLSGDMDGTVILWNIETGSELQQYTGEDGRVHHIVFTGDGSTAIIDFAEGIERTGSSPEFLPDFLEDLEETWDTVEIHIHSDLGILREWIEQNRAQRDFTCDEREVYLIPPFCEAHHPQAESTADPIGTTEEASIDDDTPENTPDSVQPAMETDSTEDGQESEPRSMPNPDETPELDVTINAPAPNSEPESGQLPPPSSIDIGETDSSLDEQGRAVWLYAGQTGETLTITVETEADLALGLRIREAESAEIIAEYNPSPDSDTQTISETITLPQDGDYIIEIGTEDQVEDGAYTIIIVRAEGD